MTTYEKDQVHATLADEDPQDGVFRVFQIKMAHRVRPVRIFLWRCNCGRRIELHVPGPKDWRCECGRSYGLA